MLIFDVKIRQTSLLYLLLVPLHSYILKLSSMGITVRRALPWPPNKLFLQVSQSGYANLINGHASLQSMQQQII